MERIILRSRYSVAIIGGGVLGLMTAHKLLRRGIRSVAVFERNFVGCGQSSRNSGGIRAQWGSEANVRLMMESKRLWRGLTGELDYNILYEESGYLFIAMKNDDLSPYNTQRKMQNSCGLKTVWLEPDQIELLCPGMDASILSGGNYFSHDATAHHDAVLHGLMFSVKRQGGELYEHTPVLGLKKMDDGTLLLATPSGETAADWVVNCAAHGSVELAGHLGINLPIKPLRRELLATQPLKHFLDPVIVSLQHGFTLHQDLRGELLGNIRAGQIEDASVAATFPFIVRFAKEMVHMFPGMKYARVLRQWAGTYDITPDGSPIVGPTERIPNFIQATGSSGHGFMISPLIGKAISEYVATGRVDMLIRPLNPERFERRELITEPLVTGKKVA